MMTRMDYNHLEALRSAELQKVLEMIPTSGRVLEIGGGNGFQARTLAKNGYAIRSIDLPTSEYRKYQVFPVESYDGKRFPVDTESIDVIFTSNLLEHLQSPEIFFQEVERVLKPTGISVHIVPTSVWSCFQLITNYVQMLRMIAEATKRPFKTSAQGQRMSACVLNAKEIGAILKYRLLPKRHGETGNAITEILHFHRSSWRKLLDKNGFVVTKIEATNLFYTGHSIFGKKMTIRKRRNLSKILGSSCLIFQASKKTHPKI